MAENKNSEHADGSKPVEAEAVTPNAESVDINSTIVTTTDDVASEASLPIEQLQSAEPDSACDAVEVVEIMQPTVVEPTPTARRSAFEASLEVLKLFLIPALILAAFAGGIAMIGVAQRNDWITSANGDDTSQIGTTSDQQATDVSYICPMMCVPPTSEPGRCPVCAMELVPAASGSSNGPSSTIEIDPRSRRVAGIETTVARSETLYREVRGVGEISYDESKLKTLSAYIDGRIEELYADYTGVTVKKGDKLAMLYSPDLYSAQGEYVRTIEFSNKSTASNSRIADSNRKMLTSSRSRLIELGMTEDQVANLEQTKTPDRRIGLHAPMSGTVIEMMAKTGQYIKAGTPVYKLADLSTVWLVLELFPEDARLIQVGQKVTATTKSNAAASTVGTVEFVEPTVDPKMRTVGVRVSIKNENGELKPGEFARATLKIPLLSESGEAQPTIVVPRDALLSVGQTSLVYVEGKPGVFEIRRVKTGPTVDGMVAVFEGVAAGENVVSRSTFLLDAQMQLQGNPSLMDPDKAVVDDEVQLTEAELEEIRKAMEPLSEEDRKLAEAQVICPVTEVRLGSMGMGTPVKLEIEGRTVFICCEGCRDGWVNDPDKYFKILDDYAAGNSAKPTTPSNDNSAMPQMDLPQMQLPTMDLPKMDLPKMELPK